MKIGSDLAELIQCSLSDCDAPRSDRPMFAVSFKAFGIEHHGYKGLSGIQVELKRRTPK